MLRAIKVRLYPNKEQARKIRQNIGSARFVYNWALALRNENWQQDQTSLSILELSARLTELKTEYAWLKDSDSTSLQQSLKDMDAAYKNFFASLKGKRKGEQVGFPQFHKKTRRLRIVSYRNVQQYQRWFAESWQTLWFVVQMQS